jgi:hypothetical protein
VPVVVTPLKSQVKKVTPVARKKKVLVGAKKLCAVMNVKTGATRAVTSTKTGMNLINEFDTEEALIAASAAMETNADPVTAKSVQAATLPLATPISLATSAPMQRANLKKTPTSNPLANLKQHGQATEPSLSQALTQQHANLQGPSASNPLADRMQNDLLSSQNGTSIKLFMLPPAACVADQEKCQIFAIDLVENRSPAKLCGLQLFTTDKNLALEEGGHCADPLFHNLLVGCQQSQPQGPNVLKQATTKNSKTIDGALPPSHLISPLNSDCSARLLPSNANT